MAEDAVNSAEQERYYDLAAAAERMGLSQREVLALCQSKRLKARRGAYDVWRIAESDIRVWEAQNGREPTGEEGGPSMGPVSAPSLAPMPGRRQPKMMTWAQFVAIASIIVALGAVWGLVMGRSTATTDATAEQAQDANIVATHPGEAVILIAGFGKAQGAAIRATIEQAAEAQGLSNLAVEVKSGGPAEDDASGARALGQPYGAHLVIWQSDSGGRATVSYAALRDADYGDRMVDSAAIDQGLLALPPDSGRLSVVAPEDMPEAIWLFAVAQAYDTFGDAPQAARAAQAAVDAAAGVSSVPWYELYLELGWLYQTAALDDSARATEYYTQAVRYSGLDVVANLNRGWIYYSLGADSEAMADYGRVVKSESDNLAVRLRHGALALAAGYYAYAVEDYTAAIRLQPDDAGHYAQRALAYIGQGQYDLALADCDRALEIDPDYAQVYESRGQAYAAVGESEQALQAYDRAIELDPDYAAAYRDRGVLVQNALSDCDRALQDFAEAIRCDPDCADAYYGRALCREERGEYGQAMLDYTEVIRIRPDDAAAYCNRAAIYHDAMNDEQHAIADYTRAIEIDADCMSCYMGRAAIYLSQGDLDRAADDAAEAARIDPDNVDCCHLRALIFVQTGEYQRAIASYSAAIRLQPDNAEFYYERGTAYREMGSPMLAEKDMAEYERLSAGADQSE